MARCGFRKGHRTVEEVNIMPEFCFLMEQNLGAGPAALPNFLMGSFVPKADVVRLALHKLL